jgi:hypothetical protein
LLLAAAVVVARLLMAAHLLVVALEVLYLEQQIYQAVLFIP